MPRQNYVQHPKTGKLVRAEDVDWPRYRFKRSYQIMPDIDPFVSPVDGSVVSSRSTLRAHNDRNDVVNFHEFDGHWEKKAKERADFMNGKSKEHKKDVLRDVIKAVDNVGRK